MTFREQDALFLSLQAWRTFCYGRYSMAAAQRREMFARHADCMRGAL